MPGASVEQAYAAFFVWHAEALAAHPPAEEAGVITRANGTLGLFLRSIAELCNGSTYDSDSYCLGSNPSSAAKQQRFANVKVADLCLFLNWSQNK